MIKILSVATLMLCSISVCLAQKQSLYAGPSQKIIAGAVAHLEGKSYNVRYYAWKTSGSGVFSNKYSLITDYKPSIADILKGSVKLTLYNRLNVNMSSSLILTIAECNTVDIAMTADTICGFDAGTTYDVNASAIGSAYQAQWTTNGTGYFYDENALSTTYEPSRSDIGSGRVWLKITLYDPLEQCPTVSDSIFLKLNDPARIDLPDDDIQACGNEPIFIDGGISGTATTVYWSTNGSGTFSENPNRDTYYYPSVQDKQQGSIVISGRTNDPQGPCRAASDHVTIYLNGPVVDAGADLVVCGYRWGGSIYLEASATNADEIYWETNGFGGFDDPNSFTPTYYYDQTDVNNAIIEMYATVSNWNCGSHTDTVKVWLQAAPRLEFPEPYVTQCVTDPVYASVYLYGHASSGTWTTTGSGTFDDPYSTYTAYYPSYEDGINGCIDLIFTSNDPAGPCRPVSGSMSACFWDCSGSFAKNASDRSEQLSLKPNPAHNIIELQSNKDLSEAGLYVTDITGERKSTGRINSNTIDISKLQPGHYTLHIIAKDGKHQVARFIKR